MEQLITGLNLLCQADPCAEMHLQEETGEYILAAAGELHLEQCLKDLRERFTKIEIEVSSPMVPFRESITDLPAISDVMWKDGLEEERGEGLSPGGVLVVCTPSGNFRLGVSSGPLSHEIIDFILSHKRQLKAFCMDSNWTSYSEFTEFSELLKKHKLDPELLLSLGPRRLGPNLLMVASSVQSLTTGEYREFVGSIISGFQVATEQGPLCAEPMMGVRFTIEFVEKLGWPSEELQACQLGNIVKGQLISTTKDACHRSFLSHSARLMLAMYSCNIQTTADVLGRVYSVVARRMGTILSEEYNDGTGFFSVNSLIPVIESFGFADDIRGRTSGLAIPQLLFHGFRLLDQDPFWVPTTDEELEDFGEIAEKANVALRYLIGVRERKGLFVEKKIVQFAEKQRTLKK
jgi:ribosome assembly protein 1